MRDKLVIIGASGHGKVIADIAKLNGYKEIIFLDDDITKTKNGKYDVVGTGKDIDKYLDQCDYFVAIGNNDIRKQIAEKLEDKKIIQPVLIHPAATVDETAKINRQIFELKQKLTQTDYKAIKYSEGLLTDEEYAEVKAQRQEWRAGINKLEEKLQ